MRKHLTALSLVLVAALLSMVASRASQGDGDCPGGEDDAREAAFTARHPDDGRYLGTFSGVADNDLDALALPLFSADSHFQPAHSP